MDVLVAKQRGLPAAKTVKRHRHRNRHIHPNHAGLPGWERYSLPRRQTLLFADDSQQTDDPRGGERRLYQQAPFIQRGTF